jgi:hypothetical protein
MIFPLGIPITDEFRLALWTMLDEPPGWTISAPILPHPTPVTLYGPLPLQPQIPQVPLVAKGLRREPDLLAAEREWSLSDGFARLTGNRLSANFETRSVFASNVSFEVPGYRVRFRELVAEGIDGWIDDLDFVARAEALPLLRVRADRVDAREDGTVRAERIRLSVLGLPLPAVRVLNFRVKPNRRGDEVPNPQDLADELGAERVGGSASFSRRWYVGGGFGVNFGSRWSANLQTAFSLLPSGGPAERSMDELNMKNDFFSSFYSNVRQPDLDTYLDRFRIPRLALVGFWDRAKGLNNFGMTAVVDRPFALGVEWGGALGPTAARLQVRAERLRINSSTTLDRTMILGCWALLQETVGRGVRLDARVDGVSSLQAAGDYTWIRPMVGAAVHLWPQLRLSAAYHYTQSSGPSAPLVMDRVLRGHEVHLRADAFLGNTTIGFVNQYNAEQGSWYRPQVMVQHPIGALLPWVKFDGRFDSIGFGFTLRTDALRAALRNRRIEGPTPGPTP